MYDFREGLLLDQSIYKDNTCDWKAAFLYILSMLVCYAWGLGWWYLFYYLYGTYEKIVFWIWIAIFIIHYSFHHYYYNRSAQPSKWEKKKGAKEKRGARKVRTRKANSKFKKKKNR